MPKAGRELGRQPAPELAPGVSQYADLDQRTPSDRLARVTTLRIVLSLRSKANFLKVCTLK